MSHSEDEIRIPVVEEAVTIGVRETEAGSVTVRTRTEVEELALSQDLARSRVFVDRVPINRRVESLPDERFEGDVRILPVMEERLIVSKELWLVEELHIRREDTVERVDVPVSRRVTRVEIDRTQQQ